MRELTDTVLGQIFGGQVQEHRTVLQHEVPRFESPPSGLAHFAHPFEESGENRAPDPTPLHWLPPRDDLPRIF